MKWYDDKTIEVIPPKKPKKITGTRFGAILGANKWNTPFKAWCEITRTFEEPFIDNKFVNAGKAIEPKQIQFMSDIYGMAIKTPTDIYGKDYFKKTFGDFFPENPIFGGMWDCLEYKKNKPVSVLEMKTSQRVEDWVEDIPEYYAMQAALYAYLLGVDQVYMVASFLEPSDYDHPEEFEVNTSNTIIRPFKVSERYPNFNSLIETATEFWNLSVLKGKSPSYSDRDADIIKALKTTNVNPDTDLNNLVMEAEELKAKLDAYKKSIETYKKRYDLITGQIKELLESSIEEDNDKAVVSGNHYVFTVSKSEKVTIDTDRMKSEGIYDKYSTVETSTRLTIKENK